MLRLDNLRVVSISGYRARLNPMFIFDVIWLFRTFSSAMEGANSSMHIPEMDKYGPPIFNEPVREGMQTEVRILPEACRWPIVTQCIERKQGRIHGRVRLGRCSNARKSLTSRPRSIYVQQYPWQCPAECRGYFSFRPSVCPSLAWRLWPGCPWALAWRPWSGIPGLEALGEGGFGRKKYPMHSKGHRPSGPALQKG